MARKRKGSLKARLSRASEKTAQSSRVHLKTNLIDRLPHVKQARLLIVEWFMLVIAITLLAITQAFWYIESYATTSWAAGGTYTEATLGSVNSLNPLFASTASEKTLSKLMFATLSAPDYSGHTGLGLAKSMTADEKGSTWTVKLREDLKWSDGEPLSNKDVLFTVSLLQNTNVASNYTTNLTGVKVSEGSGGELIFKLPAAYANFPSVLNIPILPEHVLKDVEPQLLLEHSFSATPVTSGPFKYNATQAIGSSGEKVIYLERNPNYYKATTLLDDFVVHAYPTTDEIVKAINSGAITATAGLAPTDADKVNLGAFYEKQTALSSGVFAFINCNSAVFEQKALRKAVQQGLDMRSLRAPLRDETALDYPLTKSQVEIENYPELPEYNPDEAKATIAEKYNADDPSETIRLVTVNTGYLPALAENLRYQLEQLGFSVELVVSEPTQDFLLTTLRPRNYDILLYEIELGSDPDLFAYYHSSQASENGLNLSNYKNAFASDLLLAARSTMDSNLRAKKYESFLKFWVDDAPAIGIYQVNMSYYVNKNVRSFSEDSRLVSATDRFADVSYWSSNQVTMNRTP